MARPDVVVEFQPGSNFINNIRNVSDEFATGSLDPQWEVVAGAPVVGAGDLYLDATEDGSAIKSIGAYDLNEGEVVVKFDSIVDGTNDGTAGLILITDTGVWNGESSIGYGVNNTGCIYEMSGTTDVTSGFSWVTYGPWLRVRATAGVVYWESSPDSTTWTVRRSEVAPAWISNVRVMLLAQRTSGGPQAGTFRVETINPGGGWVDISDRVQSVETRIGREDDLSEHPPGEATVVLFNNDRRFDPDNADGIYAGQLLPRVPFRIRAVDAGLVSHDLFYGFVEGGWEQSYAPPADSTCTVQLVDMLAVLNGMVLTDDHYSQVVLAGTPKAYWKLTDDGSLAVDSSGNGYHGSYRNEPSKEADGLLFGQPARKFDGISQAVDINVPGARLALDNLSSATIELWCRPDALPITGEHGTLFTQGGANAFYGVDDSALVAYDNNMTLYAEASSPGSGFYMRTTTAGFYGTMHVVFTVDPDRLYINGVQQATGAGSLAWAAIVKAIAIGGNVQQGTNTNYFNGLISHVALYQRALEIEEVREHYEAGLRPLNGQRTDERIRWILEQLGIPATYYDLDEGLTRLGPGAPESDGLAAIRGVVSTEQGSFYVDHANGGVLRFKNRYARLTDTRSTTSQATFSDEDTTGVYHYERDSLSIESNGVGSIINQASVSWTGGTVVVQNAASVGKYGARGISVDTIATDPAMAESVGEWITSRYSEPLTRVTGLALSGADTSNYDAIVDLCLDDRNTLRRHPQEVGDPITQSVYIEGIRHMIEPNNHWRTEYYMSNATDGTWFVWGVSEWGVDTKWGY